MDTSLARTTAENASANAFSIAYLEEILTAAKAEGYEFLSLRELRTATGGATRRFSVRIDVDQKPRTLLPVLEVVRRLSIPLTIYIRPFGPYNIFWYTVFPVLREAAMQGHDIGLHTAAVEWATLNGIPVEEALAAELRSLRSFFDVRSVSPHRDVNFAYNTLPWLEENWQELSSKYQLEFQAYDRGFFRNMIYVNEGLAPHLGWRSERPEEVIKTGKSIYMLLHPHWWYVDHPFERD
jgi:hypothetical protein